MTITRDIVTNAQKFTADGRLTILIRLSCVFDTHDEIETKECDRYPHMINVSPKETILKRHKIVPYYFLAYFKRY